MAEQRVVEQQQLVVGVIPADAVEQRRVSLAGVAVALVLMLLLLQLAAEMEERGSLVPHYSPKLEQLLQVASKSAGDSMEEELLDSNFSSSSVVV